MPDNHPTQAISEELLSSLMRLIRGQFCGDMTGKEWGQHYHWIRKNVVLWPAHFVCNVKKFTLPIERYEQIMRGIFDDIKAKGKTQAVKFWPGYLMHCVQEHWKHHWEEYYDEAKAVRNVALHIVATLGKAAPDENTVDSLAAAYRLLAPRKTVRKPAPKPGFKPTKKEQLSLL